MNGVQSNCRACGQPKDAARCKPCAAARQRRYCAAHPEKVLPRRKAWRAKNSGKIAAYTAKNLPRQIECTRRWRQENPEAFKESQRAWRARNREFLRDKHYCENYGIGASDYDAMNATQDGKCAICETVPARKLFVDHDHTTGAVRALLCRYCNTMLGNAKDSASVLRAAASYLERFK